MELGRSAYLRLAALILVGVMVQVAAISQITVLGASADILPLIVVSIGLLCGPTYGATIGFLIGLVVDTALLQTMGVSSLVYLAIGYGGGKYKDLKDTTATLVPLGAGLAASLAASVGYMMIQFLLGVNSPVSILLVRQIAVTVVLSTALAIPVFLAVRWLLRPVLGEDVLPRRRKRDRGGYIQGAWQ